MESRVRDLGFNLLVRVRRLGGGGGGGGGASRGADPCAPYSGLGLGLVSEKGLGIGLGIGLRLGLRLGKR